MHCLRGPAGRQVGVAAAGGLLPCPLICGVIHIEGLAGGGVHLHLPAGRQAAGLVVDRAAALVVDALVHEAEGGAERDQEEGDRDPEGDLVA